MGKFIEVAVTGKEKKILVNTAWIVAVTTDAKAGSMTVNKGATELKLALTLEEANRVWALLAGGE